MMTWSIKDWVIAKQIKFFEMGSEASFTTFPKPKIN
jgi:hypothetical protein